MKESSKAWLIFLAGFLTFFMSQIIPVAGGGASLILVLSVPVLMGLGGILAIIYYLISKRISNTTVKRWLFLVKVFVLVLLALLFYPYNI